MGAKILLTGGAGYIGSHAVRALLDARFAVTVLDDLSTGRAIPPCEFARGSLADAAFVDAVLARGRFDAVMHFAARSCVGESMRDPLLYWRNNVAGSLNLLEAMRRRRVRRVIFSSSAAVYGETQPCVTETTACAPTNPYGRTKLAVEQALHDSACAHETESVVLRYFNAAGAHPDGSLGECHSPETHLIPLLLDCALGRRSAVDVFGSDYPTADGTCVRDYVHVCDLADAHVLALDRLLEGGGGGTYNLGNSRGHSVREVIEAARAVTARRIEARAAARRAGDPAVLIADSTRARTQLGWRPRYESLREMIGTAWQWHARRAHRPGEKAA